MYQLTLVQLTPFLVWLLLFLILAFKRENWALLAVVFLLPSYFVRFEIFFPTTLLEIMIYLLAGVFILKHRKKTGAEINAFFQSLKEQKILVLGIGLVVAGVFLSTVFSDNFRTSLGLFKGWFLDPLLFFFLVVAFVKKSPDPRFFIRRVFKALGLSGVAVGIIAIHYLASQNLTFDGRLRAFYLSSNQLAMYLAPCLLAYLGFLTPKLASFRLSLKQLFKIIGLALIVLPLFFTYSAGGWLATAAALIFLTIQYKKTLLERVKPPKVKKYSLGLGLIVLIAITVLFVSSGRGEILRQIAENKIESSQSRLVIWRSALKILKDNWLLGIGPGTFQKHYLEYQKYFAPYPEWAVPQPHNIFLAFWLQTGILGFAGFLAILVWLRKKTKLLLSEKPTKKIAAISAAIMIYTLLHGLVDTTYWKNDLSVIFWIIIGAQIITYTQISEGSKTD